MKHTIAQLLKHPMPEVKDKDQLEDDMEELKLEMLHLQQVAWATGKRAVILFEGFDAAGKGTCIRHLTETLDPRSATVVPIGAPTAEEKGQHYLQRFWKRLPSAGHIVVFDRSWYGRVLVEKVEELTAPERLQQAYREINAFEKMLEDDGILLVKIFLVVSKEEQLKRFKDRLEDPYKTWKITEEDVRNRRRWDDYVVCADEMLRKCKGWNVVPSDSKPYARREVLKIVTRALKPWHREFKPKKSKRLLDKLEKQLLN